VHHLYRCGAYSCYLALGVRESEARPIDSIIEQQFSSSRLLSEHGGNFELDEHLREPDMAQKYSAANKPQAPKGKAVTGAAAVAEMAAMERQAKRQQQSKDKRS
jgi:hypothetical protein